MTVPSESSTTGALSCDGSLREFSFTFPVQDRDDIDVILIDAEGVETTLTRTTDYSVVLTNDGADGGTVTTHLAYDGDHTLTIERNVALTQTVDLLVGDPYDPEVLESLLDRLVMALQQVRRTQDEMAVIQGA